MANIEKALGFFFIYIGWQEQKTRKKLQFNDDDESKSRKKCLINDDDDDDNVNDRFEIDFRHLY